MCGIAGIYSATNEVKTPLPLKMMRHRGPDSTGEWWSKDRRIWLGCARLAILDLTPKGNQPMVEPTTGNVIVFNGEIYNHEEIRNNPRLRNVNWQGRSDTETLLVGYSEFGEQIVPMLKGMFAFIIWDERHQYLFAARDRLGIKPLYYSRRNNRWFFSSETRLFEDKDISKEGLSLYLRYGACQDEELILRGIKTLPAGSALTVNTEKGEFIKKYWPITVDTRVNLTAEEAKHKVREALEVSVREHLMSDVPVASFLSGGIDSSIITALAAKFYSGILKTISLGFSQRDFDETAIAKKVSDYYSTDHTEIRLSHDDICEWVKEAVSSMDLPSVDAINTYIVSKAAGLRGVKVALSGLGGDELFGGYPAFRDARYLRTLSCLPRFVVCGMAKFGNKFEKIGDVAGNHVSLQAAALARRVMVTNQDLQSLDLPRLPFKQYDSLLIKDDFGKISWAELRGYMRNMLLRDSDQMSMAVSLELRVPFLDHQLVELCLSLSGKIKQTTKYKGFLLEACRDLLPEVYQKSKKGFLLPMDDWIRKELKDFSNDGLAKVIRYFPEFKTFITQLQAKFENKRLYWTRLWAWVVLGHWLSTRKIKKGF